MKSFILFFLSLSISVSAIAQHESHQQENRTNHQHSSHLDTLVSEYLGIKNALVQDDYETAKEHVVGFAKEVKNSSEMIKHEEHSEKHMAHHSAMLEAVDAAKIAEDLKSLRVAFKSISTELVKAVENQGYDEKLFVQYCPMDGAGSWLSAEEKVQNPFLGQTMPTCGSVEKVIE